MTLATHAITGAAVASALIDHSVVLALGAAYMSHYALDAIPHWDMKVHSPSMQSKEPGQPLVLDRTLVRDLLLIALDGSAGMILALVLFAPIFSPATPLFWLIFFGAAFGMAPDALQFLYMRFPHQPITALQRIHDWFHAKKGLEVGPVLGLGLQCALAVVVVTVAKGLF